MSIRRALLTVLFGALLPAGEAVAQAESPACEADPGSIGCLETKSAIILQPKIMLGSPPGPWPDVIKGQGELHQHDDIGDLASAAFLCSDRAPVWLGDTNHFGSYVVFPSQKVYPGEDKPGGDLEVVKCIAQLYHGYFTARLSETGKYPFVGTSAPFASLFFSGKSDAQTH